MSLIEKHPIEALMNQGYTAEEAVRKMETPATQIADIYVDFAVDPLIAGFPTFEKFMYLRRGQPDLVTIAARPGVGKTALAMQIALNVSVYAPVEVFSLEMGKDQIMKRLYSVRTGKTADQLRHPINAQLVANARETFRMLKLRIDDENGLDVDTLYNRVISYNRNLRNSSESGLGLVVVDYLQILGAPKAYSKAEEVGYVTESLKNLAKEIKAPVLALAQMNREFDKRLQANPVATPSLSDIADSAAIEKWSDVVLCLHRPQPNTLKIYGLKNRHGDKGEHEFQFVTELTQFIDSAQTEI